MDSESLREKGFPVTEVAWCLLPESGRQRGEETAAPPPAWPWCWGGPGEKGRGAGRGGGGGVDL